MSMSMQALCLSLLICVGPFILYTPTTSTTLRRFTSRSNSCSSDPNHWCGCTSYGVVVLNIGVVVLAIGVVALVIGVVILVIGVVVLVIGVVALAIDVVVVVLES